MRDGAIESLHAPRNPLDVLAQQVVAMVAMEDWQVDDLAALLRRAAPFAVAAAVRASRRPSTCSPGATPRTRSPSSAPAWCGTGSPGSLSGRPGAQRLAVTSGGTIPDRGLFGVFLAAGGEGGSGAPGRRTRRGDGLREPGRGRHPAGLVQLAHRGHHRRPGAGLPRTGSARPAALLARRRSRASGRARAGRSAATSGCWRASTTTRPARGSPRPVSTTGPSTTCSPTSTEQREATGHLPDDRTIVVERFRDELGDWRLAVHSPFGAQVHQPWALAVAARARERLGVDAQVMHTDDGLILRLPDADEPPTADLVVLDPDEVEQIVQAEVGGSALFASRFRECAARALLLPRRDPKRRTPLWQQRQRSAQLLSVASSHPTFPIVLETVRECLQDVFDVPGLTELMRNLSGRGVRLVEVETSSPSPFARSLLFGYVGAFMYEGDSPLAERRAQALSLDSTLLAELLGSAELRELLDPEVLDEVEAELQRTAPDRRARDAEGVADLLRVLGDLTTGEVEAPRREPGDAGRAGAGPAGHADPDGRRAPLGRGRGRRAPARRPRRAHAGRGAGRVPRAGPGPARRPGLAATPGRTARSSPRTSPRASGSASPWSPPSSSGWSRTGGWPAASSAPAASAPNGATSRCCGCCAAGAWPGCARRSSRYRRRPWPASCPTGTAWAADPRPAAPTACSARSSSWPGRPFRPARWRRWCCRVASPTTRPALLDELCSAGEVVWAGAGSLPGNDGWVRLVPADAATLLLPDADAEMARTPLHDAVLDALADGAALFFRDLSNRAASTDDATLLTALWDLVWAGELTNDTVAPLRARLSGRAAAARSSRGGRPRPMRSSRYGRYSGLAPGRPAMPSRTGPPSGAGRWWRLPGARAAADPTAARHRRGAARPVRRAHPRRGRRRGHRRRVRRRLPGAVRVRGRRAAAGGATSSRGSARPSSRFRVPWTGCAAWRRPPGPRRRRCGRHRCRRAGSRDAAGPSRSPPGRSSWRRPTRRTPTALRCPGRSARPRAGTGRGGRQGRWSCCCTGRSSSTSSGAARRCCRSGTTSEALQPAADALALAVRGGALGKLSVEKADGEAVLVSDLGKALEAAGFRPTPRGCGCAAEGGTG